MHFQTGGHLHDLGLLRAPNTGAGNGAPPVLQRPIGHVEATERVLHPSKSGEFSEAPAALINPESRSKSREELGRYWREHHIDSLFKEVQVNGASDLHLCAWKPPMLRVSGVLAPIKGLPMIDENSMQKLVYEILSDDQVRHYETNFDLDCSHALPNDGPRFRVNVARTIDGVSLTARMIPLKVPNLDDLGLPKIVKELALNTRRGLVLVTGVTGSGKSTTLAAMIHEINKTRRDNILTMEDPVEYVHRDINSKIIQREIGTDSKNFNNALRAALRQDPEVILVGEMRDAETISQAITAAETGHLVLATLHTKTAASSIERIIDSFDPKQQAQVRVQLAQNLQAVVCQQLLPVARGEGRAVATEVMICTPAIRNLIKEGKASQMTNTIQMSGQTSDMITMDRCLTNLVMAGRVSREKALEYAIDRDDLTKMLAGGSDASGKGGR